MVDEPLDRGDVVRWLDDTGRVIWTMKHLGLGGDRPATEGADAVLGLDRPEGEGEGSGSPAEAASLT